MSDYIVQNNNICDFINKESWIILSPIERQIKNKIEQIGTPLKNWDVKINYGIKTGINEAINPSTGKKEGVFIISESKKDELIAQDPKSAEIIRPILRGKDIKRYTCEYANLWLINTHNGLKEKGINPIDINDYPAIKRHLDKYYPLLEKRSDKGDSPYNLRNCAYTEDFYRQKIIYPNMTKFMPFLYDDEHFMTNQKCFIITGENIAFLTAFFNSSLFKYCFRDNFPELQGGTRELSKIFFDLIPVIQIDSITNKLFFDKIVEIQRLKKLKKETIDIEITIDNMIFDLYNLNSIEREIIGFIEIQ